jgi:protein arginine kinase
MKIPSLTDYIESLPPWAVPCDPERAVLVSTRIRLARNLSGEPFPQHAGPEALEGVRERFRSLVSTWPGTWSPWFYSEDLSPLEQKLACERRFATALLMNPTLKSAFAITNDTFGGVMLNEEDHVRLQYFSPGLDMFGTWRHLEEWDDLLLNNYSIAFSKKLGFLTSCPTNVGTGMRASVTLHLPGFVLTDQLDPILRGASRLGLTVRGVHGEGSEALGNMFQLSNQSTLGDSEEDILARIEHIARHLAWTELNLRKRLLYKEPATLYDYVGRAYGALRYARRMTEHEALDHLGAIRLGLTLNLVEGASLADIDQVGTGIQPGHLQFSSRSHPEKTVDEQVLRADFIRIRLNRLTLHKSSMKR